MSGAELAGFITGLSGLTSIFDKACATWRAIRDARSFGEDVVDSIMVLEMEFYRFLTWWQVLEKLAINSTPTKSQFNAIRVIDSPIMDRLWDNLEHPIIKAAAEIQKLFGDVQAILQKEGVLQVLANPQTVNTQLVPGSHDTFNREVKKSYLRREKIARDLNISISWWKRVKHDATPWRESSKSAFATALERITYWNQTLYDILPSNIRDTVRRQGISGCLIMEPEEVNRRSKLEQGDDAAIATLYKTRQQLGGMSTDIAEMRKELESVSLNWEEYYPIPRVSPATQVGFLKKDEENFLVEWYPFPNTDAAYDYDRLLEVAEDRLKRLSLLLKTGDKLPTLRALPCRGCFRCDDIQSFGLVSELPPEISKSVLPISMHSLLSRNFRDPVTDQTFLPTLRDRFAMAATLASCLYTFMLAKWHHKRFNSKSILFAFREGGTLPDLRQPLVCGYGISRPSQPEEISLFGQSDEEQDLYLHPQLRQRVGPRPKYCREHEVYAFGVLLVEIGFWNTVSRIATTHAARASSRTGEELRDFLISKCTTDLACWAGPEFRDATLRCLKVGDKTKHGCDAILNDFFFWEVIMPLKMA